MRNLYLDLDADKTSSKAKIAEALMDIRESDTELFAEAEDVLLHVDRKRVYDAIDTQYHAYAQILNAVSENQHPIEPKPLDLATSFVDTHHWSKRLIEF